MEKENEKLVEESRKADPRAFFAERGKGGNVEWVIAFLERRPEAVE